MKTDIALGLLSIFTAIIGQAAVSDEILSMITQFGGLGLAVWLTIHHTMVTIPRMENRYNEMLTAMEERHRQERVDMIAVFNKTLEEKRADYKSELDQQRISFAEMLGKASCRYEDRS